MERRTYSCPLCGIEHAAKIIAGADYEARGIHKIECPRCGTYFIAADAEAKLLERAKHDRSLLAGVARERSEQGRPVVLAGSTSSGGREREGITVDEALHSLAPHSVLEQAERALMNLALKSNYPGAFIQVNFSDNWPLLFVEDKPSAGHVLAYMVQSDLLYKSAGQNLYAISEQGWRRVRELQKQGTGSHKGFVAMSFKPEMDVAYDAGIKPAIEAAGYVASRADRAVFEEKIDDYLIKEIRKSCFVVVDVTWHRNAVYFEARICDGDGCASFLHLPEQAPQEV